MFFERLGHLVDRTPTTDPSVGPHQHWRPTTTRLAWPRRVGAWRRRRRLGPALRGVVVVGVSAAIVLARPDGPALAPTRPVVLAAAALPAGHVLDESDLRVGRIVTDDEFAVASDPHDVVGRVLVVDVEPGAPLGHSSTAPTGLRRDERAIRLPAHTDAPAVEIGQRVDVLGVRLGEFGGLERERLVADARVEAAATDGLGPVIVVTVGDDLTIAGWLATGAVSLATRP